MEQAFLNRINDSTRFYKHISLLTESQKEFLYLLNRWFSKPKNLFVLISGGPGSGKTFTVRDTLRFVNATIVKMAPTAKVAENIGGRTLFSMLKLDWGDRSVFKSIKELTEPKNNVEYYLEQSNRLDFQGRYSSTEIVVLDEVGMIPFWLTYQIVNYFFKVAKKHVLFIAMGDFYQLKPPDNEYNVFQVSLKDKFPTVSLFFEGTKRFTEEYNTLIEILKTLTEPDKVYDFLRQHFPIVEDITSDLFNKCSRMLVYTNDKVDQYNYQYLETRFPEQPLPTRLFQCQEGRCIKSKYVDVKKNCLVVVTENNCGNVTNGTCLVFDHYDSERDAVFCRKETNNNLIEISRSKYTGYIPIAVAFAGTIHKFQGETIDDPHVIFHFNNCVNINLIYTALSRVRSVHQILAIVL